MRFNTVAGHGVIMGDKPTYLPIAENEAELRRTTGGHRVRTWRVEIVDWLTRVIVSIFVGLVLLAIALLSGEWIEWIMSCIRASRILTVPTWTLIFTVLGAAIVWFAEPYVYAVFRREFDRTVAQRAAATGVNTDEAKEATLARFRWMVIGNVIGAIAGLASWFVGLLPAEAPSWFGQAVLGAVLGYAIANNSVVKQYPKALSYEPMQSSMIDGAWVGGAIGFLGCAVWNAVMFGSYDPKAVFLFLLLGSFAGAAIGAWTRAIKLRIYPRVRFVFGVLLSGASGAFFLRLGANEAPLSSFRHFILTLLPTFIVEDGARTSRVLLALGALLGISIYLLARNGRWPRPRLPGTGRNTGAVIDGAVEGVAKARAIGSGVVAIIIGISLAVLSVWIWLDFDPGPSPRLLRPFWKIVVAVLVVTAAARVLKGLADLRIGFKGAPLLGAASPP
jgi:hypothetical protein